MNMDKLALSTTRVLYKTIVFNLVLTTVLKVHADAPAWATTHRGRLLASKNMPATDQYASLLAANPTLAAQLTPQFHVRPPSGWVNDPNGPLEYPNGTYHLFFQHNPVSSNWGAPYWAHVVSNDLVHWRSLPHALIPDTEYDYDGVFSGSATILNNGTPAILYTGVSRFSELGHYYQVQALATPANLSDPDLVRWVKRPFAVMADAPPGGTNAQWRDPTTAWVAPDDQLGPDSYWAAVGAQQQCVGGAALYASGDFVNWKYRGLLFSQASLGEGSCASRANASACDQFSSCPMNECPDVFTLGGNVTVIKYSDQVRNRVPFGQDWYIISDEPLNYSNPEGTFVNSWRGRPSPPRLLDWGSVYASKTFPTSDGRRIWWGWAYETAVGCTEMCSQGTPFTDAMGWQGMQTLPREVALDREAGTLLLKPVRESTVLLPATPYGNANSTKQFEAIVAFALDAGHNANATELNYNVGIALTTAAAEHTVIRAAGTWVPPRDGQGGRVLSAAVYVDTRNAGGATQAGLQGGIVPLPPQGIAVAELQLRVFVDHSILETYALDGRACITTRMYPLTPYSSWGLSVFAADGVAATTNCTLWSLGSDDGRVRTEIMM